jgi:hypothetical protein
MREQKLRGLLVQVEALFKEVAPPASGGPTLLLDAHACRCLDDQLGLGATQTATTLVKAVDRLGAIRVGDIRIPFTPGQLTELQHRAQKRGRTVEAEMRAVVARIEDELFYKGG